GVAQEVLEDRFVVPAQADRAPMHQAPAKDIDDGFGVVAAVDVVAEVDFDGAFDRPPAHVFIDPLDHVVQQIGTPVNIADRIDAGRLRNAGAPRSALYVRADHAPAAAMRAEAMAVVCDGLRTSSAPNRRQV